MTKLYVISGGAQSSSMTSSHAAYLVLDGLGDILVAGMQFCTVREFVQLYRRIYEDNETSSEWMLEKLELVENMTELHGKPIPPDIRECAIRYRVMLTSLAFCVEALKAEQNSSRAWYYVQMANRWLGVFQCLFIMSSQRARMSLYDFARKGAAARHAENWSCKETVFQWCDENMAKHKSMNAAAEAVANKLVPYGYRTVRDWMTEWKKLRPPGTP